MESSLIRMESSAAEKVVDNTEMLWEILIRVPLKALLRLSCVSKPWKALISDQQFRNSHTLHHHQHKRYPNSLILASRFNPHYIISFTAPTTLTARLFTLDFDFIVLRSCNGLLLCRLAFCSDSYFIYNPITRDFTNLNLGTHPLSRQSYIIDHYLAFDPSVSSPFYKVVSFGPPVSVSIPFPLAWESDSDNGVYCNGAIHWCNRGEFSVYFDVDAQCLKYYSMPLSNSEEWLKTRIYYFGESGGRLHLILPEPLKEVCYGYGGLAPKPSFYDIFELKEDYSGWLLTHRIDMKSIRLQFTHMRSCFNYYIFHKNKSSISVLIVAREGAIINDPVDNTSTKLCDFEMGTSIWIRLAQGRVVPHFDILC